MRHDWTILGYNATNKFKIRLLETGALIPSIPVDINKVVRYVPLVYSRGRSSASSPLETANTFWRALIASGRVFSYVRMAT
jgi:hypothetical protein